MKQAYTPSWELEQRLWQRGLDPVAGVDEAGRGALCGPVVAAAVILPPHTLSAYRDSKTLTSKAREQLAERIKADAIAWAVGFASAAEVDSLNVLAATRLAAVRAVEQLNPAAAGLVTDYLKLPLAAPQVAVAKADARSYQVAAASILAKTTRDAYMIELGLVHPRYGLAAHKGYGVSSHLAALAELGPCPEHRLSFRPVSSAVRRDDQTLAPRLQ